MRVHLYGLVWNEIRLLPFFLEHYREFVDRFFLFDDGSDDGSAEFLAAQQDVELGTFATTGDSFVAAAQAFYNECWKASRGRADWVVVVNVDELLVVPSPRDALGRARRDGFTALPACGWEMVAETFPERGKLVARVPLGLREPSNDKLAVFDPAAIEEIGYAPGRHQARPSGRIHQPARPAFNLLHFKHLGLEYVVERYTELSSRLRPGDREHRWGIQYDLATDELEARHARMLEGARPVLAAQARRAGLLHPLASRGSVVDLKGVANERGGLREVWGEGEFGPAVAQIYVTNTLPGVVKAWYRHRSQADQIVVFAGALRLVLFANADAGPPDVIELDGEQPQRVHIPRNVWHGFKAIGEEPAVLLHLNDRPFR